MPVMNLNNLNLNEKIEDLLAALKKKEDEVHIYAVVWPVLSWPERKKLLNEL